MKKIYTLLLVSIIFTSVQSQSVDLSLKLEKRKEYNQVTSTKSTVEQNMMGQEINMLMTVNGAMTYKVKDINENGYEMEAVYNNLSMSMEMPQGTQEFSSEIKDTNDNASSVMSGIKDIPFEIVMSKTGKIKEVRNTDALWQTAIDNFGQLSEEQKEHLKTQLKSAYGDGAIKSNMELVSAIYPSKPVKKGDKWTVNTNLEDGISGVDMEVSTEYELIDLTQGYALINGYATIETNDNIKNNEMTAMQMKFDLSGTKTSEIKVDINTGWIIEAKITQKIEGEIEMKMDNDQIKGMYGGMKISMKMLQETLITN